MESRTKFPVTADDLASVVASHLGGAGLAEATECTEGWFNAVHQLTLDDGRSCVLKIAPPPDVPVMRYEADIISSEVAALRLIRRSTSVPVPEVLAWDTTCEVLPTPFFLMSKCDGVLLDGRRTELPAGASERIDAQLLEMLRQMHSIDVPSFGLPSSATHHDRWSAAFAQLVNDLLADAADASVALPASHDEIRSLIDAAGPALDEVDAPVMVHWDLWDPNVFIDPVTHAVTGVVDLERVLWADPLLEAQFTGSRSMGDRLGPYGTDLFSPPGSVTRRCLYDLYLYLVMTIECAYRNYGTPDIETLARAMLDETLTELRA